jgi:hypothetical protein
MLISDVINTLKDIALSHKDIESFDMGDQYLIEGNLEHQYPKFFLETPFNIAWATGDFPAYFVMSFAFYVLMNKLEDNVEDQIQGVSDSALITEQILTKINHEVSDFSIELANSLTYNDTTNEGLSTTRTDLTLRVLRNVCESDETLAEIFTK